jgi:hypothetical protein
MTLKIAAVAMLVGVGAAIVITLLIERAGWSQMAVPNTAC